MLNSMAIGANDNSIGERVSAALRFGYPMVNIASGLGPSAAFAAIPIVLDRCLGPPMTGSIAMLPVPDDVAFALVPRPIGAALPTCNVEIHATAGLDRIWPSQTVGCDALLLSAIAETKPGGMAIL